ncbi:MAG TPA: hypothetical protein VHG30_09585 [Microvirga sp.]|nr:hypothetical protein [Microvirga sp.]
MKVLRYGALRPGSGYPDGSRPALGAALGRRSGPDLRVVLVIGREAEAVETTARRVAREHLGASGVVTRFPSR